LLLTGGAGKKFGKCKRAIGVAEKIGRVNLNKNRGKGERVGVGGGGGRAERPKDVEALEFP